MNRPHNPAGYNPRPSLDAYHRGAESDDIETKTGRAALLHLDLVRGERFTISALLDDAIVMPGKEDEVKLDLLDKDGYSIGLTISVPLSKLR